MGWSFPKANLVAGIATREDYPEGILLLGFVFELMQQDFPFLRIKRRTEYSCGFID